MELISAAFAAFTVIFLIAYYVCPKRFRWMVLLLASYCYYIIICGKYVAFILFTTASTYFGAVFIDILLDTQKKTIKENAKSWSREQRKAYKETIRKKRIAIMLLVLILNFGLLGFLKYIPYASRLGLLLPLGISFYTFQSMGYLIDVYQEKVKAQTNFFKLALFVSFFPQIIQGPIAVYDDLAGQLYEGHAFDYDKLKRGALLVLWGAFKKMVIADRAVVVMNYILSDVHGFSGSYVLFAAVVYALQLYTDFSGGIDIVRGIGEMFGITMAENFRQPYFSKSIGEFWRRWHITLGTWMKDYVFYPFCLSKAMNKFGKWGKKHLGDHLGKTLPICLSNLLIFFIVGIWHGAEWRYIMYGMYNGVIIAFSNLVEPLYKKCLHACHINPHKKWWQCVQILRTFILVNIGWVFDCSVAGMGSAIRMIKRMITDLRFDQLNAAMFKNIGLTSVDYIFLLAGCVVVLIISVLKERGVQIRVAVAAKPIVVRWLIYYGIILAIFVMGYASNAGSGFLYANF